MIDLVSAAIGGDKQAFSGLVEGYRGAVCAISLARCTASVTSVMMPVVPSASDTYPSSAPPTSRIPASDRASEVSRSS